MDKKDGSTLWECEELALRYLLEDGKLNLCLRNLVSFKEEQRAEWKGAASSSSASTSVGTRSVGSASADASMKFEKGMSLLLKNAWYIWLYFTWLSLRFT